MSRESIDDYTYTSEVGAEPRVTVGAINDALHELLLPIDDNELSYESKIQDSHQHIVEELQKRGYFDHYDAPKLRGPIVRKVNEMIYSELHDEVYPDEHRLSPWKRDQYVMIGSGTPFASYFPHEIITQPHSSTLKKSQALMGQVKSMTVEDITSFSFSKHEPFDQPIVKSRVVLKLHNVTMMLTGGGVIEFPQTSSVSVATTNPLTSVYRGRPIEPQIFV